jgi:hypothetical protein
LEVKEQELKEKNKLLELSQRDLIEREQRDVVDPRLNQRVQDLRSEIQSERETISYLRFEVEQTDRDRDADKGGPRYRGIKNAYGNPMMTARSGLNDSSRNSGFYPGSNLQVSYPPLSKTYNENPNDETIERILQDHTIFKDIYKSN